MAERTFFFSVLKRDFFQMNSINKVRKTIVKPPCDEEKPTKTRKIEIDPQKFGL